MHIFKTTRRNRETQADGGQANVANQHVVDVADAANVNEPRQENQAPVHRPLLNNVLRKSEKIGGAIKMIGHRVRDMMNRPMAYYWQNRQEINNAAVESHGDPVECELPNNIAVPEPVQRALPNVQAVGTNEMTPARNLTRYRSATLDRPLLDEYDSQERAARKQNATWHNQSHISKLSDQQRMFSFPGANVNPAYAEANGNRFNPQRASSFSAPIREGRPSTPGQQNAPQIRPSTVAGTRQRQPLEVDIGRWHSQPRRRQPRDEHPITFIQNRSPALQAPKVASPPPAPAVLQEAVPEAAFSIQNPISLRERVTFQKGYILGYSRTMTTQEQADIYRASKREGVFANFLWAGYLKGREAAALAQNLQQRPIFRHQYGNERRLHVEHDSDTSNEFPSPEQARPGGLGEIAYGLFPRPIANAFRMALGRVNPEKLLETPGIYPMQLKPFPTKIFSQKHPGKISKCIVKLMFNEKEAKKWRNDFFFEQTEKGYARIEHYNRYPPFEIPLSVEQLLNQRKWRELNISETKELRRWRAERDAYEQSIKYF